MVNYKLPKDVFTNTKGDATISTKLLKVFVFVSDFEQKVFIMPFFVFHFNIKFSKTFSFSFIICKFVHKS